MYTSTNYLLLLIILLLASCQEVPTSKFQESTPQEAGFDAQHLSQIDSLVSRYMADQRLPGGVFLVARHGKIAYHKSFGYHSLNFWEAYQKDDLFRIASMTKAVTTVAIMQLYEKGLLRLDDPLSDYLPAYATTGVLDSFNPQDSTFTTIPAERAITIRHLLTHTSGIVYGDFMTDPIRAIYEKLGLHAVGLSHPNWTTEQFINTLAKAPLLFQPGSRYNYGLNMDVLGRVVEVASGQTLENYFNEHIFAPLNMKDTYFYLPKEKQQRLVPIYSQTDSGTVMLQTDPAVYTLDYTKHRNNRHFAGGGGLTSSAMDYARFLQALLNGGSLNGKRILGRKTIELMTSDQLAGLNQERKGYSTTPGKTMSLGFGLLTEEATGLDSHSPGTYYWSGYFSTQFFIDPKEDLLFVGMTQVRPFRHGDFYDRLTAIIYGAIED